MSETKEAWQKFYRGDHLTDDELKALLKEAKAAVPYLENRGPEYHLALVPTRRAIMDIEGYLQARKDDRRRGFI